MLYWNERPSGFVKDRDIKDKDSNTIKLTVSGLTLSKQDLKDLVKLCDKEKTDMVHFSWVPADVKEYVQPSGIAKRGRPAKIRTFKSTISA